MTDDDCPSAIIDAATVADTGDGTRYDMTTYPGPSITLEPQDDTKDPVTLPPTEILDRFKMGELYVPSNDSGLYDAIRAIADAEDDD